MNNILNEGICVLQNKHIHHKGQKGQLIWFYSGKRIITLELSHTVHLLHSSSHCLSSFLGKKQKNKKK